MLKTTGACALGVRTAFPVTSLRMAAVNRHVCLIIVCTRQVAALAAGARMMRMMMTLWRHLVTNNHLFHLSLPAKGTCM